MSEDFSELLPVFLEESQENIEKSHKAMKSLENGIDKKSNINDIARYIHTIKGSCSSFGFKNTGKLAHELENRLQDLKLDPNLATKDVIAEIQVSIDKIEDLINNNDSTDTKNDSSGPENSSSSDESVRVPVKLINSALNNIWEIFLIKNQIGYLFQTSGKEQSIKDFLQNWDGLGTSLGRNIAELENKIMQMRMTNLKKLFSRMEKIVRTYAIDNPDKKIRFVTSGEDTEVDKKVSDMLNEPLVHLIRNAMDHGLESSQKRSNNGKKETGLIELKAKAEVDTIEIIVSDDGGGIDHNKVVKKALEKKIISTDKLTEKEAINLIFTVATAKFS